MRRIAGALMFSAAMAAAALTPQSQAPLTVNEAYRQLLGKDCGKHLSMAMAVAADPGFASHKPVSGRAALLGKIANCGFSLGKYDIAFRYADRAAELDPEDEWLQTLRMYYGTDHGRPEASLDALQVLSRIEPSRVRELDLRNVDELLRAARDASPDGDEALAAYEALDRAGYVVAPPNFDDFLRMGRGRLLLERGRVADAGAVLRGVVDASSIVEMRVDRAFDPLRADPAFVRQVDIAAAVRKDLERSRGAMQADPKSMEAVYLYAGVLDLAMRDADGLELVEEVLARDRADPAAFHDADEYRNWINNKRANFLYSIGRADEGREALVRAAGLQEHGTTNVSNIINLGGYLIAEGRGAEAVALIPRIGRPSPYGQAWIESMRSCAGVQLKDEKLRLAGLEYLRSHEADNPAALSRALICSNDLDAAAALMIRRLSDRELRTSALLDLQITPPSRLDAFPFHRAMSARFDALRDRADVRDAVAKVGRIERLPVRL